MSVRYRTIVEPLEGRVLCAAFTVTNTGDAGPGSLRQAMTDANATPGQNTITFDIAGGGVHTVRPLTPLPELNGAVVIDGRTQPGYRGTPVIELDGTSAGATADGLVVRSSGVASVVRGLAVNRFGGNGVVVWGPGASVEANHIGTTPAGDAALPNAGAGLVVYGTDVFVGTTLGAGNLISGNGGPGIRVIALGGSDVQGVVVAGNRIGTDATGSAAIGNGGEGIVVEGSSDLGAAGVGIGGVSRGAANLISGNAASGVRVAGNVPVTVWGNRIGSDATGTRVVPNGASPSAPYRDGVTAADGFRSALTVGGDGTAGNLIVGNHGAGVRVTAGAADIRGNRIGSDGGTDLGNVLAGIDVGGGSFEVAGNLISGNGGDGVHAGQARGLQIYDNRIGTNATGDAGVPNDGAGVSIEGSGAWIGGTTPDRRNVISGNRGPGILMTRPDFVSQTSNRVEGNYIGTDVSGGSSLGNGAEGILVDASLASISTTTYLIGGATAGSGNVISGNAASGVRVLYASAGLRGNRIGTDAGGARAVPNGASAVATNRDGVHLVGAPGRGGLSIGGDIAERNVISGNGGAGVYCAGAGAYVRGNFIGTDAAGLADLGNANEGVVIRDGSVTVTNCLVSGNGGAGIRVSGGGATVAGNYIGTDATGRRALGNDGDGIDLSNPTGFTIGEGRPDLEPPPPPVIDPSRATRNIISANGGHGVRIVGGTVRYPAYIQNCNIGTDVTGTVAFGNGGSGVYVATANVRVGGFVWRTNRPQDRNNVISGNRGDGVTIVDAVSTVAFLGAVQGNRIGTTASGDAPLGNGGHGVAIINSGSILVGERDHIDNVFLSNANTVAHNGGAGVLVLGRPATPVVNGGEGIRVSRNRIFSNAGQEIDLGGDGPTANDAGDADDGANRLLNFPVISEVAAPASAADPLARTFVRFSLGAEPMKTYDVEFFSAAAPDAAGRGQAARFIGLRQLTTDAAGRAEGEASLEGVAAGEFVSAVAIDVAGNTSEFGDAVRAVVPEVVGRYVFYNRSGYDGHDAASNAADDADDAAIAPDKYPLFRAGGATFANMTSYVRGINGVMIDVARLPDGAAPTADDFEFLTGPGDDAAGWTPGPVPASVTVRRGAGVGGSDRVTLVWADYGSSGAGEAVANGWLRVTVKATSRTGLSRPDVFYFGNLVGNYDDFASRFFVSNLDLKLFRWKMRTPWAADHRWHDFNQDGVLNVRDLVILRANIGRGVAPLSVEPVEVGGLGGGGAAGMVAGVVAPLRRTAVGRRTAMVAVSGGDA